MTKPRYQLPPKLEAVREMESSMAESTFENINLNVLLYKENEEWVALSLQMDLRGYGETVEESIKDLVDLVEMQIGFALFKGNPESVWKPAEAPYWILYEDAFERAASAYVANRQASVSETRIADVPLPPPHVIAGLRESFSQADA